MILRRLAAMLYDSLLLIAILMIATALLLPFTHGAAIATANHFFQLYLLALIFSFYAYFWMHGGQTLGMLVWKLKITSTRNQPMQFWQILLRFIIALISIPLFGLGLFWIFIDKNNQSLYDRLSMTKVELSM